MDMKLYADIVRDIKSVNKVNAYDTYYNIISEKYPSIPEETLRSIISLWFQRKVTQNSWRVKEIKIYDLYRKLIASGTKDACLHLAFELDYPPALVAKIVLTSYMAEMKSKKSHVNSNEVKNLRKQQCPYCKSLIHSQSTVDTSQTNLSSRDKIPSIRQHHDPRVELALNLFDDEDDEIGKYFLEKFTFSNDKDKKRGFSDDKVKPKSSKFFWQASSFEEMGEKNVKQFASVEKLFSNRLCGANIADRFSRAEESESDSSSLAKCIRKLEDVESEMLSSVADMKLNDSSSNEEPSRTKCSKSNEKNHSGILDTTMSSNDCDNSSRLMSANDSNSTFDESLNHSREGAEMKICTCGSGTVSDTSDSDSEDSDEAYENFSVKELFENPSLIEDPVLARDIFNCTSLDDQYGPTADVICSSSGITHEKLLEDYVKSVGLVYKTEDNLRGDGFDKTPDIILLVPVAVNNFVINWVESKALFADYKLHQDFEKKQFQNYVNRFGPGLVIYWQGYVNEVLKSDLVNKKIIISDKFPPKEQFTFIKLDKFKSWMQLQ